MKLRYDQRARWLTWGAGLLSGLALSCGGSALDGGWAGDDAGAPGNVNGRADAASDVGRARDASADGGKRDVAVEAPADASLDATQQRADASDGSADSGCIDCSHLPHVQPGAPVECRNGQCYVPPGSCAAGFAHCTVRPEDGCETDLSQASHCGSCGNRCLSRYVCVESGGRFACALGCTPERHDICGQTCVDLQTDVRSCGTCYHSCELPNTVAACEQGKCKVSGCKVGWGDCTSEVGCETRLDQADHCGVCGNHQCTFANTTPTCVSTGCGLPICKAGFANCDMTSPDCETPFGGASPSCWPTYRGTWALGGLPSVGATAAVAPDGSYVIGGDFGRSGDFNPGAGLDVRTPVSGTHDGFVTKLNADGSYGWTRTFGGEAEDAVTAVAVGPDGSIYATGYYENAIDLDPGPGTDWHTNDDARETFVVKLAADGSFVWGKTFAQTDSFHGQGTALRIADDGSVYVAGRFRGTIDLDPGPGTLSATAGEAGFLVKLTSGGALAWGRSIGGPECQGQGVSGLALGSGGTVWVVQGEWSRCSVDPMDVDKSVDGRLAIASFGPAGDYRGIWRVHGGSESASIAMGADNSIYVGGTILDVVDFDPGPGKVERVPPLNEDDEFRSSGFIVKLGAGGVFRWVQIFSDTPITDVAAIGGGVLGSSRNNRGFAIFKLNDDGTSAYTLSAGSTDSVATRLALGNGQFLIGGMTDGLGDFDPGPGTDIIDRGSVHFVSRYGF